MIFFLVTGSALNNMSLLNLDGNVWDQVYHVPSDTLDIKLVNSTATQSKKLNSAFSNRLSDDITSVFRKCYQVL